VVSNRYSDITKRLLTIVILAGMTIFFRREMDLVTEKRSGFSLAPPPPHLKYYSFGFNESIADGLWLRYIQDLDKCKMHGRDGDPKTACDKGWAFQMLDQITDLAPKFRMPFAVGPISLSVLLDDYDGAGIIFEKALKAFPKDWKIQYKAAYFYLFDRNDPIKAAHLLLEANANGGPAWLPLLASKLYDRSGQLALGISTLTGYLKQIQDPNIKKRVEHRLARLMCERDALAQGRSSDSCSKEDSD
jgi:hypothetical protein